jgi:membrane-associated protease RseP (regulator of RpoE activity)
MTISELFDIIYRVFTSNKPENKSERAHTIVAGFMMFAMIFVLAALACAVGQA